MQFSEQQLRDLCDLVTRGMEDLDCYLADGSPDQDGYTPDEVAELVALQARAPALQTALISVDPGNHDQEPEHLRGYDVTVVDTCERIYRAVAFDEDSAVDRALELYEAGFEPAEDLGITDRVLNAEEITL